jgi:hypothetical protein
MSFITAINELSSSLILYVGRTMTMPVRIYLSCSTGNSARHRHARADGHRSRDILRTDEGEIRLAIRSRQTWTR